MTRTRRSFVALLTVFSVACSGSTCGATYTQGTKPAGGGALTSADPALRVQADPSSPRVEALVEDFGRVLAGVREGERLTPEQARARLQKLYGLLETTSRSLPRDTFDFSIVAGRSGRQPAKLRDWVSSHTTLVPYRGALRDAAGTLMDRVGNSLDRALLLARLIRESGGQVRLARARLTTDQALGLFEKLQRAASFTLPAPAGVGPSEAEVASVAQEAGVTPEVVRSHSERIGQAAARIRDDVQARVKLQSAAIAQAVRLSGDPAGPGDPHAATALQDHWWVQWKDNGAWVDLDPAADGPAQVLVQAQETTDPGQIAADLHHQVEIRVIVERWDGSQLTEASPVSVTARPSEVIGTVVEFRQLPMAWPAPPSGGTSDGVQRFRNAVLAQREWLPTLTVGTRRFARASVTETGELNDRPGSKPNDTRVSAASGSLDALGGGGDEPGILTAEWLEYVIRVPGAPARTIRREIFDLLGPAARAARRAPPELSDEARLRRGLSLIGETDILLVANHLSGAFIAHQMVSSVQAARSVLESLVANTASSWKSLAEQMSKAPRPPGKLHELASVRQTWGRESGLVYTAQPNIFSRHALPAGGPDAASWLVEAIDIVASEVDVHPAAHVRARLARLEQGVLDANLEAALMGPRSTRISIADVNVGESMGSWIVARRADDLSGLTLPADMRTRIEHEILAGYVVLVAGKGTEISKSAAMMGWWRIDPRTGHVLAVGDRGWGQSLGEYALITVVVALGFLWLCRSFLGTDQNGYTVRDAYICLAAGAGGGLIVVAAIPGVSVLVVAIVAGALGVVATGISERNDSALDQPLR